MVREGREGGREAAREAGREGEREGGREGGRCMCAIQQRFHRRRE
jgi:hypothetical protein